MGNKGLTVELMLEAMKRLKQSYTSEIRAIARGSELNHVLGTDEYAVNKIYYTKGGVYDFIEFGEELK